MAYLNARTDVKTVFGTYSIKRNEVAVELSNDDSIYDYVLRDPQYKSLQNEIEQVSNNSDILMSPKDYLAKKNADLLSISDKLKDTYKTDFLSLLEQSYSQSEAKKIALEQSAKRKEFLMSIHKKKFPKELSYFKDKL